MKKIIPILFLFFIIYGVTHKEEIIIPDYAIRFRVIANSDSFLDQSTKIKVKDEVENKLDSLMQEAKNSTEAKELINTNLNEITKIVDKYSPNATISFGQNYFPDKTYKGVHYPSGEYESLVITLGRGAGENWWCVMFPSLCFVDESKSDVDSTKLKEEIENIEPKEDKEENKVEKNTSDLNKEDNSTKNIKVKFKIVEVINDLFK